MQKKLIALAVAGLASTAAFAQSNVTIYGVVDAGYVNSSVDRAANGSGNFSGIQSGVWAGSRLGFRGEEGLGNGLKAVFTLEYGLNNDAQSYIGDTATAGSLSATGTRQSFVGLSSDKLGTVALGRQYAPGFYAAARSDAFAGAPIASPLVRLAAAGGHSIIAGGPARANNAVTYTSPTFAGFQARAIYGYGEDNTGTNGISAGSLGYAGVGLGYSNGPLTADVAYHSNTNQTVAGVGTQDDINNWIVSATYDLKVAKLFAAYQAVDNETVKGAAGVDNKLWNVGVTVPVFGNGKVHASYGRLSWDRSNAGDSNAAAVGYTHALSKRTMLYTTYTRVTNDRNVVTAAGAQSLVGAVAGSKTFVNPGEDANTFTAGISHTF